MKKLLKKRRSIAFLFIIVLTMSAFSFSVSAAKGWCDVKEEYLVGGLGTLIVASSTEVYAKTSADEPGRAGSWEDYVSVNFQAYSLGTTVWGPTSGDTILYASNSVVYCYNYNAGAIQYANSQHAIVRDTFNFYGAINGITPG